MANYKIDYSETYYKSVSALTTDTSTGVVIPNGQEAAIVRVRCNGADPSAYVAVIWDYGGGSEKILVSTKGDVDLELDSTDPVAIVTGDGSKKIQIVIINDNINATPIIGGAFEVTKIG